MCAAQSGRAAITVDTAFAAETRAATNYGNTVGVPYLVISRPKMLDICKDYKIKTK